jgi:hypothetical protein
MENSYSLANLTDDVLLAKLAGIIQSHRKLTSELIAYLAEVDARKLYLVHAAPSMFVYSVTKLGFSEDEACRRIESARLARRFPCIFQRIERGEVSLSVLGRLKPFLTDENAADLLDAARGRTVREVERILAERFPKPDIPDTIRKLPEPKHASPPASRPASTNETLVLTPPHPPPRADRGKLEPLSADRIQVKFTATRKLEKKLEQAGSHESLEPTWGSGDSDRSGAGPSDRGPDEEAFRTDEADADVTWGEANHHH